VYLAIDTSTRYAGIALSDGEKTLIELTWRSEQNHSVELLPTIQTTMERLTLDVGQLTGLVVATGPGNFSALRVGMSTTKGLAMALGIPLVGISTLELEAFPYLGTGMLVCPVIDARRGQVALALYDGARVTDPVVKGPMLATLEEICSLIETPTLFCGEGLHVIAEPLRQNLGHKAIITHNSPPTRRPAVLAYLGSQRLKRGEVDDPAALQPTYLRGPSITAPKRPSVVANSGDKRSK